MAELQTLWLKGNSAPARPNKGELTLEWFRGHPLNVKAGFFAGGTALADLTNVASVTLKVTSEDGATVLMSKTVAAAAFTAATAQQFLTHAAAHATFAFSAAEANIAAGSYHAVLSGLRSDGGTIPFGFGKARCLEDHAAAAGDPPENPDPGISGEAAAALVAAEAALRTAADEDLQDQLDGLTDPDWADVQNKPSTFPPENHNHNASAITEGTLDAARLPAPAVNALGGVKRNTGSAGQFVTGIDASGNLEYDDPPASFEFNVKDYGATGDARMVTDGVLTSGDNTVSSATGNFTAADVGKAIWGTNTAGGLALPLTTVASVTNSTTIEVTDAPGANWTDIWLVLGTDDTAAIQAAAAAADAAVPKGLVTVPRGGYVFSDVLFDQSYASGTRSYGVRGEGKAATVFYPAPNHACTGGYLFSNVANVDGGFFEGFSIEGAYVTFDEAGGLIVMRLGSNVRLAEVRISRTRNTGHMVQVSCPGSYVSVRNCHFEFSSAVGVDVSGSLTTLQDCYSGNHSSYALTGYGGNAIWMGGVLDECAAATVLWQSIGRVDLLNALVYAGTGQICVDLRDTSTLRAVQSTIRPWWIDGSNNATAVKLAAGTTAHLSQNTLTGSGTGHGLNNAGTVYEAGGNVISSFTGAGAMVTGPFQFKRLANDFTNPNAALADVTGMFIVMEPNGIYEIMVQGGCVSNTTTEAPLFSLNGSAAAANIVFNCGLVPTTTTWSNLFTGHAYDEISPTLGTGPGTTERPFYLHAFITNGNAQSTVYLRLRTETGGGNSATAKAGMAMRATRLG
jgi:hypothetical protein